MFEHLIESQPGSQRTVGQSAMAVTIHVLLIVAAVRVTRGVAEAVRTTAAPTVFLHNPPPKPPPPPEHPRIEPPRTEQPKVRGFDVLVPPKDIPLSIPPVDIDAKFDGRRFDGIGVPGGDPNGILMNGGADVGKVINGGVYTSDQVTDQVTTLRWTPPRYPKVLEAAGVEGVVQLEFVVGVNGRADSASIRVISSTNERFNEPAIETIRTATYKPAKISGVAVPQLVRQGITFSTKKP